MERPGITQLEQHHRIQTIRKDPINVKYYPMPYTIQEIIKGEVEAMLETHIIEPSKSEYCYPVVIVKKKDGSNRFSIDFQKLNLMTMFHTETMGDPDDIMGKQVVHQYRPQQRVLADPDGGRLQGTHSLWKA